MIGGESWPLWLRELADWLDWMARSSGPEFKLLALFNFDFDFVSVYAPLDNNQWSCPPPPRGPMCVWVCVLANWLILCIVVAMGLFPWSVESGTHMHITDWLTQSICHGTCAARLHLSRLTDHQMLTFKLPYVWSHLSKQLKLESKCAKCTVFIRSQVDLRVGQKQCACQR